MDDDIVDIALADLVMLLAGYMICLKRENQLGELGETSLADILNQVSARSSIKVTKDEMINIMYHLKHAILEDSNFYEVVPTYSSYIDLTKRMYILNKESMKLNSTTGEAEFKDGDQD